MAQTDTNSATKTYEGFISFVKWGTAVVLAITAIVVLLISS